MTGRQRRRRHGRNIKNTIFLFWLKRALKFNHQCFNHVLTSNKAETFGCQHWGENLWNTQVIETPVVDFFYENHSSPCLLILQFSGTKKKLKQWFLTCVSTHCLCVGAGAGGGGIPQRKINNNKTKRATDREASVQLETNADVLKWLKPVLHAASALIRHTLTHDSCRERVGHQGGGFLF